MRISDWSSDACSSDLSGADFAEVENVVLSRCSMCHAAEPLWEGVEVPPKGVVLETPGQIRAHARAIGMQAVHTHAMPPGNVTFIEEGERQLLAPWIAAGARSEERRVGKECVRTVRSRCSPYP